MPQHIEAVVIEDLCNCTDYGINSGSRGPPAQSMATASFIVLDLYYMMVFSAQL